MKVSKKGEGEGNVYKNKNRAPSQLLRIYSKKRGYATQGRHMVHWNLNIVMQRI